MEDATIDAEVNELEARGLFLCQQDVTQKAAAAAQAQAALLEANRAAGVAMEILHKRGLPAAVTIQHLVINPQNGSVTYSAKVVDGQEDVPEADGE